MFNKIEVFLYSQDLWKKFIIHTGYVLAIFFSCVCSFLLHYISNTAAILAPWQNIAMSFLLILWPISVLLQIGAYILFLYARVQKYTPYFTLAGAIYPILMILFALLGFLLRTFL